MRAQHAPAMLSPRPALTGACEHAFGGDRRRAGEAEHLRVGAFMVNDGKET